MRRALSCIQQRGLSLRWLTCKRKGFVKLQRISRKTACVSLNFSILINFGTTEVFDIIFSSAGRDRKQRIPLRLIEISSPSPSPSPSPQPCFKGHFEFLLELKAEISSLPQKTSLQSTPRALVIRNLLHHPTDNKANKVAS